MFKSVTEIFGSWFHLSAVHEIVGHTHIEEVELRSSNSPSFLCGSESQNKIPYERILKNAEVVFYRTVVNSTVLRDVLINNLFAAALCSHFQKV